MSSVGFFDAGLVGATLAEAVGRTGDVPGSVGAIHIWFLLTLL